MARFELGVATTTPGALELLAATGTAPTELLRRHHDGDWGELDGHDRRENERSLRNGWRVLSSYPVGEGGRKVWIITEADRSSTTILLPEEY
jgi:hypothetical protein